MALGTAVPWHPAHYRERAGFISKNLASALWQAHSRLEHRDAGTARRRPWCVAFLRGVDFFWTTGSIWSEPALVAGVVLAIFVAIDLWYYRTDRLVRTVGEARPPMRFAVSGSINLLLIAAIIAAILAAAIWKPAVGFSVYGTDIALQNLARDAVLLLIAILSLRLTPNEHREANGFSWEPIAEVAI